MSTPAAGRLSRILHVLAVAQRSDGVAVDAIAAEVGITRDEVLSDLTEVQERSFYHPPGFAEDVQVTIERDRVSVFAGKKFRRPPRLTPGEAVAVDLALRIAAARDADRALRLRALARRLRPAILEEVPDRIATLTLPGRDEVMSGLLRDCAREHRRCLLRYARPGADGSEDRLVHPYALVHAEGVVYLIARCERAGAVRSFRLDRTVECRPLDETFEVPEDFDVQDHILDGRVFTPPADAAEAEVRYGPSIARWIAEREPILHEEPDGAVVVRHLVADHHWLVRHVLQYGPEAEVLGPPEMRKRMLETLAGIRR